MLIFSNKICNAKIVFFWWMFGSVGLFFVCPQYRHCTRTKFEKMLSRVSNVQR